MSIFLKLYKKSYPIFLGVLTFISLILYKEIKKSPKKFFTFMALTVPFYYIWNILIENLGTCPAWQFHPDSIIGIYLWNVPIEDFFFYPICSWLLYICISYIKVKDFDIPKPTKMSYIIIPLISIMLFFSWNDTIGFSISILTIPFFFILFSNVIVWCHFNIKQYLIINLIFVPFSSAWDWHSTWFKLKYFNITEWYYPINSGIVNKASWAWILNSPISIDPFLSIAGIFITYITYLFLKGVKK